MTALGPVGYAKESLQIIKLALVTFIILIGFSVFKSIEGHGLFGPSRDALAMEITQLKEVNADLRQQLLAAQDTNAQNVAEKQERVAAQVAADAVRVANQKKLDTQIVAAKVAKAKYTKKIKSIEDDPSKTETEKDTAVSHAAVDQMWELFCDPVNNNRCKE